MLRYLVTCLWKSDDGGQHFLLDSITQSIFEVAGIAHRQCTEPLLNASMRTHKADTCSYKDSLNNS